MNRRTFDGFSAIVPDGFTPSGDEGTFSDETYTDLPEHMPTRFVFGQGHGELTISVPRLHPDEQPGADVDELESLAREWGMRRGVDEPVAVSTELRSGVARASAMYRIGKDLVELWLISDGTSLAKATYVCAWAERDLGRAAREALVGSVGLERRPRA